MITIREKKDKGKDKRSRIREKKDKGKEKRSRIREKKDKEKEERSRIREKKDKEKEERSRIREKKDKEKGKRSRIMEKKDKEKINKDCFQDLDISAQRHPLLIDTSLSTSKRYRTSLAGRSASEIPARPARARVPPCHNYPTQFPGRPHKKKKFSIHVLTFT